MNIFSTIGTSIRRFLKGMFSNKDIESAIGISVVTSDAMLEAQQLWRDIYFAQAPWNNDEIKSLGIAKAFCEKNAKLVTLEFQSDITGSARADYLNEQYKRVVNLNGLNGFRSTVEKASYNGTIILKPYPRNGNIYTTIVENNMYYPLKYNQQGELTSCAFVDSIYKEDIIYTLIEIGTFENNTYTIEYMAFKSGHENKLGKPILLTEVEEWQELEEMYVYYDVKQPWFVVYIMPQLGIVEQGAVEGSAIFGNSIPDLQKADEQEARTDWEFEGAELAIDASNDLFKNVGNNKPGSANANRVVLPKGKERLYRNHNVSVENFQMEVFNPPHRQDTLNARLNQIKRTIEFNNGYAYGTISDVQIQAKTATEVKEGQQDTAGTITSQQDAWEVTLRKLATIMDEITTQYGYVPIGTYDQTFYWDDSIIISAEEKQAQYNAKLQILMQASASGYILPEVVTAFIYENSDDIYKLTDKQIEEARQKMPINIEGDI